jgi:hypothetical protein
MKRLKILGLYDNKRLSGCLPSAFNARLGLADHWEKGTPIRETWAGTSITGFC